MYIVNASRAASKTSIQWLILQRHLRLISLHALIILIIAASIIPLYGAIGLFSPTCDVVQDGVYESQQRYSCSLYISVSSMALFRATRGFYTQRSSLLERRHDGAACSLSPIRYVSSRQQDKLNHTLIGDLQQSSCFSCSCFGRRSWYSQRLTWAD